jgi:hypothetical protein
VNGRNNKFTLEITGIEFANKNMVDLILFFAEMINQGLFSYYLGKILAQMPISVNF